MAGLVPATHEHPPRWTGGGVATEHPTDPEIMEGRHNPGHDDPRCCCSNVLDRSST
jgi:hypothetical protein